VPRHRDPGVGEEGEVATWASWFVQAGSDGEQVAQLVAGLLQEPTGGLTAGDQFGLAPKPPGRSLLAGRLALLTAAPADERSGDPADEHEQDDGLDVIDVVDPE
jgi:hypothetical protein